MVRGVRCGRSLQNTCAEPPDTQREELCDDLETFVDKNREYYVPRFREMKTQNRKNSWNWSAFLWTPYWFMYRKMYGYGFAAFGIAFLITMINLPLFSMLAIGGEVIIGIFANYIYMKWLERKANEAQLLEEPFKTQFIQKHSGVSVAASSFTIVCWVIIVCLFTL